MDQFLAKVLCLSVNTPTERKLAHQLLDMALPLCHTPTVLVNWLYKDVQEGTDIPISKFEDVIPGYLIRHLPTYIEPLRIACGNEYTMRKTLGS
ncbi:hypothetical protein SARC_14806, partial [Sphaeroforma arctica JP610]